MSGSRVGPWLRSAVLLLAVGWARGAPVAFADQEAGGGPAAVSDGAAITPEFAKQLYDRLVSLAEPDGCRLQRFDTSRFRITIGLLSPAGQEHVVELATAPDMARVERSAGAWALAVPPALEPDCGRTLAAIERVLEQTAAPQTGWFEGPTSAVTSALPSQHVVLAVTFILLGLGSARILYREARAHPPPRAALLGLVLIWAAGLALRLWLSPHTFLHEYFHIAETVPGYLTGESSTYGKTGPALFRLLAVVLGRSEDVGVIFLTTAIISSLAIPAVALLDLAVMRSWPRALCAAVLLCILPQHLRFSAAEDLFVQAVTFGLWAAVLFAVYLRTRRFADALIAVLALSLAMQARPEMLFFPAALIGFVVLVEPRSWRVLFAWRTLSALALLAVLLVPRFLELRAALQAGAGPTSSLPTLWRLMERLVFLQAQNTPPVYWLLVTVGLLWDWRRKPGFLAWVMLVYFGYALFSLSLFDNPPYNLRSQILPTSFLVLIAAGAASAWIDLWGERRRRQAQRLGAAALAGLALVVLVSWRGFVTELRDQQLEWAFLERTVPRLPQSATLLTAVDTGGRNLNAFPEFLLRWAGRKYGMIDVRRAAEGKVAWPEPGDDLIFYQGMFCYFAFHDQPTPDPMSPACLAVHARYVLEPIHLEDLHTRGFSWLRYAGGGEGPFRIGFFRLKAQR